MNRMSSRQLVEEIGHGVSTTPQSVKEVNEEVAA